MDPHQLGWTFQDFFFFCQLSLPRQICFCGVCYHSPQTEDRRQCWQHVGLSAVGYVTAADGNSAPARLSSNQIISSAPLRTCCDKAQDGDTHLLSGKNECWEFFFFSKVITFLPPGGSTGTFYWEDTRKTVIKRWVNELLYVDQYQCYLYKIKIWCGIYYAHAFKYLFRMFTVCSSLYLTEDVIPTFPLFPLIFFLYYLFKSRFNFLSDF